MTSTTCAICHDVQTFHVVTACSKPDAPAGHEPLVCFDCFASMVRASSSTSNTVTCPLCRATVRRFKKVRVAELTRPNHVVLEMHQPVSELRQLQPEPAAGQPPPPPPFVPRTSMSLFQQHVVGRETLRDDVLFEDSLRRVEGNVLAEAYRAFLRHRVYERLTWRRNGTSVCAIRLPELLRSPAHLVDDDGLCVSCLFPIHYHARQ